ncbi:glycosyltransferase [Winogradskyella sp.]|jgi:glycosyltransferase involved in cell wall biosynthesis|uniref:glycosyltransferase n=1 Tax=Winogradskyella sp. TaxID=1883156 RepID=UPI0025F875C2|nr:glycosyltransferase [Winogradskyella sp.]MCT4631020.1 glycosyltransferase [Winogradskyella sp.]
MDIATILFWTFIVIVGIQVIYYLAFLFSFSIKRTETRLKKHIPLSVIICAKNEADNLKKNLRYILEQDYSNFEVVLVNDSSSDDTLEVMKDFESKHNNIKIVDVKSNEAFWGNKKYALTLGIKASTQDFLVFTDADCKPNSNKWLSHISSKFSNQKAIVLGYGGYAKKKFSLLNLLIRFETVVTALQYFSYAKLGLPYMGVGRNMAYRKELFFNNNGFNSHMKIKSGDDDLFINEIANSKNTALCVSNESFTISEPKTSFKDWIIQKRRHISTSSFYKTKHKFLLGLFYTSQLLFWIFGILLLVLSYDFKWVISLIALRFIIQLLSFGLTAKKLDEVNLVFFAPFLEIFLISTQLSIFIANLISTPKHWK